MLKINWTDWKFWYRIFFSIFIFCGLFYVLFDGWINGITVPEADRANAPNWEWYTKDKGDFTLNFFTFFTTQTNILVIFWLFASAILENCQSTFTKKVFSYHAFLGVTIYISITGIIFNTMLLPTVITNTSPIFWYENATVHMLCPIVMIAYFFLMDKSKKEILTTKQFIKEKLGIYYIFPIVWVLVMMTRGEFRWQAGKVYAYQYFFLNVHISTFGVPGWIWLIVATVVILAIILGLSTLYNWISLKQTKKAKR